MRKRTTFSQDPSRKRFTGPSQEMVHTYIAWMCADYTSRIANVLGNSEDEKIYKALAKKIAAAFQILPGKSFIKMTIPVSGR